MHHHTINVTDPESLEFIKGKIREFMPLFTSRQFNICADETFDLGKGKSRAAAEEKGVDRIYIDFVQRLCANSWWRTEGAPCSGGILYADSRK